jgi:hypothetical protein
MIFNATKNWKKFLSSEDEMFLNEILLKTARHRGAYKNADEVKIAQLWCSFVETRKHISAIDDRLRRIEYLLGGIIKRSREQEDKLLDSLRNF